jgi:hypothetical protein
MEGILEDSLFFASIMRSENTFFSREFYCIKPADNVENMERNDKKFVRSENNAAILFILQIL